MRRSSKFRRIQCSIIEKKLSSLETGSGMTFLLANLSKEILFQPKSQKLVMKLVRHYDQHDRETDGAVHLNSMGPKLPTAFQKAGGQKFSDSDWVQYICERSNRTSVNGSSTAKIIQGHTSVNLIAPALMGHVAVPYKWKEFLFHEHTLRPGLIAGGRESKEGRQTIIFTPLNPFGDNPDEEEPCDDLSKPRKVHYHRKWKTSQDGVYWVNVSRAKDKGPQFWQARSHAVIENNSVPAHCINQVMSQKGEGTLFERLSTPRPAQKRVLKSAWQSQQQRSRKTHRRVLLRAPGNWCKKRNKALQQMMAQNCRASGN